MNCLACKAAIDSPLFRHPLCLKHVRELWRIKVAAGRAAEKRYYERLQKGQPQTGRLWVGLVEVPPEANP